MTTHGSSAPSGRRQRRRRPRQSRDQQDGLHNKTKEKGRTENVHSSQVPDSRSRQQSSKARSKAMSTKFRAASSFSSLSVPDSPMEDQSDTTTMLGADRTVQTRTVAYDVLSGLHDPNWERRGKDDNHDNGNDADYELGFSGKHRKVSGTSVSSRMEEGNGVSQSHQRRRRRRRRKHSTAKTKSSPSIVAGQESDELDGSFQSHARSSSGRQDRSIQSDGSNSSISGQSQAPRPPDRPHSEHDGQDDVDNEENDKRNDEEEPKSCTGRIMAVIVGIVTAIYGAFCIFQKCCPDDEVPVDVPPPQPDPGA